MGDRLTSWLRTVVPGLWSLVLVTLARWGLPKSWADFLGSELVVEQLTNLVAYGVAYAVLRWVEPALPDWATRVLLGSARPPRYYPAPPVTGELRLG